MYSTAGIQTKETLIPPHKTILNQIIKQYIPNKVFFQKPLKAILNFILCPLNLNFIIFQA